MNSSEFRSEYFWSLSLDNRIIDEFASGEHSTRIQVFCPQKKPDEITLADEGTHFGFVQSGNLVLSRKLPTGTIKCELLPGMYFCVPGPAALTYQQASGACIIITRLGYKGMFLHGGPVEDLGRLKYIDDGTATSIILPPKYGDPCLNYLHFPIGSRQSEHTHPSLRVGVVFRGEGECVIPSENGSTTTVPLTAGTLFIILPGKSHHFLTHRSTMELVTYHPDSTFGPYDQNHPVIKGTIVGGVSATHLI